MNWFQHESHRIEVFNSHGTYLREWSTCTISPFLFSGQDPKRIAIGSGGSVYTLSNPPDKGCSMEVFTAIGTPVSRWTVNDSYGYGLASDAAGRLYETSFGNNWIQVYSAYGSLLHRWGALGSGPGQFNQPTGIAVDAAGTLYVADRYNYRVQILSSAGTYLGEFGTYGTGPGQNTFLFGVAVDAAGNVYVTDAYNDRVEKFGLLTTPIGTTSWGALKARYR